LILGGVAAFEFSFQKSSQIVEIQRV